MSGYRLVLFLHEAQLRAAQTAAAARPWAVLVERAAKVLPPTLLVAGRQRRLSRPSRLDLGQLLQLTRSHVGGIASWTNTGLAIGVVFAMTTKPALAGSLASLAIAALLGAAVAVRLRRHV